MDGCRVEGVVLAVVPPLVDAARVEHFVAVVTARVGAEMAFFDFAGDAGEVDAFDARGGPFEIRVDHLAVEADRLEDLCAAVTLDRRDAHLGHGFDDAFHGGFDVMLDSFRNVDADEVPAADDVFDRLENEIRIDRACAIAREEGEVVDFAGFAGFEDEADLRAGAISHEVMVQAGHGEERGDAGLVLADAAVGENEDVDAVGDGAVGGFEEFGKRFLEGRSARRHLIEDGQGG